MCSALLRAGWSKDMDKKAMGPSVMNRVAAIDWDKPEDIVWLERIARMMFDGLRAGADNTRTETARESARMWTIGALVGAFPRMKRMDIRAKVQELVERVTTGKLTGKGQTQTAPLKVGDDVIIGCFYKHASGKNDKPINEWKSSIVRETPKRWVLQRGEQFDKKTNEPVPRDSMYTVRMRKAL
jgi:hypothetical protein